MSILVFTMITHEIGRVAGPTWIVLGIVAYLFYRRKRIKLPVFRSQTARLALARRSTSCARRASSN